MATIRDAINIARPIIGDAIAPSYRYSDERLTQYGNDALDMIALAKPHLFSEIGEVECVAGLAVQKFPASSSNGLLDILYVKDGNVVTHMDAKSMNRHTPGWMTMTAAAAKHWDKFGEDPNRFLVYPPAPAGQVLVCLYSAVPKEYGIDEDINIPPSYIPIIANYIIAMAESANDPSINSGRAAQFMQTFSGQIGLTMKTNPANKPAEQ